MNSKTRYLQISDVMMFEYNMLGENDKNEQTNSSFIYTRLKDGHYLLLSPISCECEKNVYDENIGYKKKRKPESINTLNHLAVPKDSQDSMFYHFLDPDYEYVDDSIINDISWNQIKARKYREYLSNPINASTDECSVYVSGIKNLRYDTIRLYFVNGYDFSNIYGVYARVTIDGGPGKSSNDKNIDLCDMFITKSTFYKLINYSVNPTMFGNNIYDRYIEINVPCLYDLINGKNTSANSEQYGLFDELNVNNNTQIRLSFAYILDEDIEVNVIESSIRDQVLGHNILNDKVELTFTRSSMLNGTIPSSEINSDHLGAYISECPDMPYMMFYATWRDKPLTKDIVWQFNKGITLYDRSRIRNEYEYEVDDDYEVIHNMGKWMCIHEIKCSFCMGDQVVKTDTYSMTQTFVNDADSDVFYYRPLIFDESQGMFINNIQVVYTMRFINSHDKVQFVKVASLSLAGNMSKYYMKGTTLKTSKLTPYKIFNKIIENKHETVANNDAGGSTKYVKVFYNSTDIVIDDNGSTVSGEYNYTQTISLAPKSYKFTFKKMDVNGTYTYMDLSNGYYKLLFKDADNNDNLIDPTYSQNMNLYVGELEFNLSSSIINKMNAVPDNDKKMSIVAYNEDGSVSSMFDFMYTM